MSEWIREIGGGIGHHTRKAGPLWLSARESGGWAVCVDGRWVSHGRANGDIAPERLAAAKAAAEAWCRTMARAVLVEVGDE